MTTLYPWLNTAWQQFTNRYQNKWPHALLVTSQPGIGVENFADYFAASLLCENNGANKSTQAITPCNNCKTCHLAANNPDYYLVEPEKPGGPIKIEQIRDLVSFVTQTSHGAANAKVIVIREASNMHTASQNALLKTLEEPSPGVYLLLLTSLPAKLLPTIVSRCQKFSLPQPNYDTVVEWLAIQPVMANQFKTTLAKFVNAPLQALAWAESGFLASRDELLADWLALRADRTTNPSKLAEKFLQWPAADVYRCLVDWVSDCITIAHIGNIGSERVSEDVAALLRERSKNIALASLYDFLASCQESYQLCLGQANINQQLNLEVLLGRWQEL